MATGFDPPDLWQPFGAFSMMQIVGQGRVVHLKGQVALDGGGEVVGRHDLPVQLGQVLENIRTALAAVGGAMGDIISLTQYVTDIEAFMQCGEIRQRFFAAPYPVTTTVEIRRLYRADLLIEIAAIAEIPLDRFKQP
ncbi:MAG TPA: RidA family protein [Dongiaceae bacterium]